MFIYLAGPMRGISQFNFPAFHDAAQALRDAGHSVFSPAEWDEQNGFDATGMTGNEELTGEFGLRQMLAKDCEYICLQADAVALMSGWERSTGANAERALGIALGLAVGPVEFFL